MHPHDPSALLHKHTAGFMHGFGKIVCRASILYFGLPATEDRRPKGKTQFRLDRGAGRKNRHHHRIVAARKHDDRRAHARLLFKPDIYPKFTQRRPQQPLPRIVPGFVMGRKDLAALVIGGICPPDPDAVLILDRNRFPANLRKRFAFRTNRIDLPRAHKRVVFYDAAINAVHRNWQLAADPVRRSPDAGHLQKGAAGPFHTAVKQHFPPF